MTVQNAAAISKLRTFDPKLPEECHTEMAQHLRRNKHLWHSTDPKRLEKFIASVFRANYADCVATHVGGPDDGGVDIVFIEASGKEWLIQVKRRENPKVSEGISTFRNLLGAMFLKDSNHGMLVSTVDSFSYRVHEGVGRAAEKGMIVRLVDKEKLQHMLGSLLPTSPWKPFLRQEVPHVVSTFCQST